MTNRGTALKTALLGTAIAIFWPIGAAQAQTTTEAPTPAPPAEGDGSAAAPTSDETDTSIKTVRKENGEVIVTARRYVPGAAFASKANIPLIETPQSVTVITRDQIDLLNFVDAQQAVRYTSGVFGENYGPDLRFDFFTVRGFTPKQYIDGLAVPVSTTIYSSGLDLYGFETFELLKGPASVLYGNAPPGGIYNETSRRPSRTFGGEVQGKFGNDAYKSLSGTVTGPLGDAISARVTMLGLDRDAERDHVSANRFLIAPTVSVQIGPSTTLTALSYYQKDKVKGDTNGFLPVYGTLLPNPNGQIDRDVNLGAPDNLYKRRQYGIGFDLSHKFTDKVSFRSVGRYSKYRERTPRGVYGGGGFVDVIGGPFGDGVPDDYRTVQQYNFSYAEDVKAFAIDNRLSADLETGSLRHQLLVGLDYRNVSNQSAFGFVFGNQIDAYDPVYLPQPIPEPGYPFTFSDIRIKQTGVYVQDHIGIGDFYLTLNGRQDWLNTRNDAAGGDITKQDKFTYRIGANYVSPSGIAPYISYATSFEPVIGTDSVTLQPFKPSTGRQVEAGVKYNGRDLPSDVKIFASAAIFKIWQKDVVQTAPAITPVFGTQVGEVEVWGGELEFVARIREQLSINGSYSYNHSEVTKSSTAAEVGAQLPVTPKHKASLFADYTVQQGTLAGFGGGFGVRYTSKSTGGLPGPFNPVIYNGQSATLFDAILHYDIPGWRFAINGSNIFDKTYVARCAGPAGCTYGAGRQIIGTVTKRF